MQTKFFDWLRQYKESESIEERWGATAIKRVFSNADSAEKLMESVRKCVQLSGLSFGGFSEEVTDLIARFGAASYYYALSINAPFKKGEEAMKSKEYWDDYYHRFYQ